MNEERFQSITHLKSVNRDLATTVKKIEGAIQQQCDHKYPNGKDARSVGFRCGSEYDSVCEICGFYES